jgi:hypothetical protein
MPMLLTRRAFTRGGAAVAAAATATTVLPLSANAQPAAAPVLFVRRSINDLIREQSPLIESFRRGVDAMMARDVTDKTSWWFQANIHHVPDDDVTEALKPLAEVYWRRCPHKNYFFPSWHRMYLYFFERILRKASGDPTFALPYWSYDDPQQASLPACFLPETAEYGTPPDNTPVPPLTRKNPLARTKRHPYVDHRWIGLGEVARDVSSLYALDRFTAADKLDALKAFGGVRVADPQTGEAAGGLEAVPHNLVHKTIGLEGDMGSPRTAARDPVFWVHHANVDRMWMTWTDPSRGRIPPVDDDVWMQTRFTFVDENGDDVVLTGADVLDTQFQLGYRYQDDPPRTERLRIDGPVVAAAGPRSSGVLRSGMPAPPVLVAAAGGIMLGGRETSAALAPVAPSGTSSGAMPSAVVPAGESHPLRVVLKDVSAPDGVPSYDVFLVSGAYRVRLGGLDLFGAAGEGAHAHHGLHAGSGGDTIAFDAGAAVAELARLDGSNGTGFHPARLRVAVVRRGFALATGGEFVPDDPDPPRIGAIELVRS